MSDLTNSKPHHSITASRAAVIGPMRFKRERVGGGNSVSRLVAGYTRIWPARHHSSSVPVPPIGGGSARFPSRIGMRRAASCSLGRGLFSFAAVKFRAFVAAHIPSATGPIICQSHSSSFGSFCMSIVPLVSQTEGTTHDSQGLGQISQAGGRNDNRH
jgi:hypothetical protein